MPAKYSVEDVKARARGNWLDILQRVGGFTAEELDPHSQSPCPKCGGDTRFRGFNDVAETGGVVCNQCGKFPNGLKAVTWRTGKPAGEVVALVAQHLGIEPGSTGAANNGKASGAASERRSPDEAIRFDDWSSDIAAQFIQKRPGLTEEAMLLCGAQTGMMGQQRVIAFPVYDETLDVEKPVGWVVANFSGGELPIWKTVENPSTEKEEWQITGRKKYKIVYGSKPGLLGHHAIQRLKQGGPIDRIWKVEGVSDMIALQELIPPGLRDTHLVVTNSNGTDETPKPVASLLAMHPVYIIHDADIPGQLGDRSRGRNDGGAARWATMLAAQSPVDGSVRNVQLPYPIEETHGRDLRDWVNEGHSYADLLALADATPPHDLSESDFLPEVELPGGDVTISAAASELGKLLAVAHTHFLRGGSVVRVADDEHGRPALAPVRPAELASDLEHVATLVKIVLTKEGPETRPANCSESAAKLIMAARTFVDELPPLRVLTRCPVLVETGGALRVVVGYDRDSGVLADGEPPADVPLGEAVALLHEVLEGFKFATPADRSRALAALITPALVFGGLLQGRPPVDLGEADQSQTGKGFRNKLTAAVYRDAPVAVGQQHSGVGSLEEAFDRALIAGKTFIALDNVRGKVDSQKIEMFLTEDVYFARAAYLPHTEINPSRVCVQFTSNKADMTQDLANRSSCVRILKQSDGYQFKTYPEGDVLAHVRANQPRYLGAVFAVVKAWHAAGKPRTAETRHDFRGWVKTLDWIVQHPLGAAPLMDGHRETQKRMTNPHLNWLRDVALAVIQQGRKGKSLIAADILDVIDSSPSIEIPGHHDGADLQNEVVRKTVLQQIGKKLKQCFGDDATVTLDGMTIERSEFTDTDYRKRYEYFVLQNHPADSDRTPEENPAGGQTCPSDARLTTHRGAHNAVEGEDQAEPPKNPRRTPEETPLMNPRDPANPANGSCNNAYARAHTHAHADEATTGTSSGSAGSAGSTNGRNGFHGDANGAREVIEF